MHKKKVALGMSGGVDSSVAAHVLVEQGYDVTGVYLECWRAPGCRTEEDRQDALKVALNLNLPFQVLDFKETYKEKVVEYFFAESKAGRTPNPDVMCNKEIKFGLFYDWAMSHGFDYVATGHYAAITVVDGAPVLAIPADQHKDQTYFLYLLTAEQLNHTLFPLAGLTKPQVRELASYKGLHVATKKDSVGICFIGDINVHSFLYDRLGENPGPIVDVHDNVIGRHQGLWFYTIGQRHGFEVDKKTIITTENGQQLEKDNIPPFYVIGKRPQLNQLIVGFGRETMTQEFFIADLHLIEPTTPLPNQGLMVRIRHTGELLPAKIKKEQHHYQVTLTQPTRGVATGQSAVLYTQHQNQMVCWGGGVMSLASENVD